MNLLKLTNENEIIYPYSKSQLQMDNPNTSFTDLLSMETLNEYNVYEVIETPHSLNPYNIYTEIIPILSENKWYQSWIVTPMTIDEIIAIQNRKWDQIRLDRNRYISDCDWTQLSDSPLTDEEKSGWITYRQDLRDITLQEDPFNITWPTKP
jgi:hypothetical protein